MVAFSRNSKKEKGGMGRIYIAGQIKGTSDYHDRFAKAADKLRKKGWQVYNPAAANLEGMPIRRIMAHVQRRFHRPCTICGDRESERLRMNYWRYRYGNRGRCGKPPFVECVLVRIQTS